MRQADSSEPAADGGGRTDHDAALTQLGLDLHQRDLGPGTEERAYERLMRRKDRTAMATETGRSGTAALAEAPHQLHSRGGAHVKT
ncbi:hypothetical protein AA309_14670 [Microvirga vignae]|uniref:Uncharacterized protein n=1 Tax=Microvirga vignae TaxID=1225564 RepID=A0A0H1RC52_9HYPH|nr:hypothetical protein [Microvirga vignae]KLK92411.1 hypothetical protein AA309_14670 [Microvirga vignae]